MEESQKQAKELLEKLDKLISKQELISGEITQLRDEIAAFQSPSESKEEAEPVSKIAEVEPAKPEVKKASIKPKVNRPPAGGINFEKFIGENLISKIGIVIMVIGVGIGAKYAIEHQMINPLTRIVLGYLVGVALLVFAIKLKDKYESYSAVLLSGSMAIMYFITFAAYSFYELIPQMVAFALMLVFTVFTTLASIKYNQQVIAHIGFVGAYAVPFLLSDGSGNAVILMSYMTIINAGILAVSIKKYWKSLYYSSFGLTWIIYSVIYGTQLTVSDDITTLLSFLTIYFLTFYGVFIGYKILEKEKFLKMDIVLLLANSFIFYGIGYDILSNHPDGEKLLGVFTLVNAVIHFGVGMYLNKQKLADKNLFYLVLGLVLTFITIAIPVQLDGSWVTLLWAGEAVLLFWIGRTKEIPIYEKLSYALMFLAFISIFQDWSKAYNHYYEGNEEGWLTPILNIQFASSILVIAAFAFINYVARDKRFRQAVPDTKLLGRIANIAVPAFLLIILYYAFANELGNYWHQLFQKSYISLPFSDDSSSYQSHYNYGLKKFGMVWQINYSLLFFSILSFINIWKIKNKQLTWVNLVLNTLAILMFLSSGLYLLSTLRDLYINQHLAEYYNRGWFYLGIRYVSLTFMGIMLFAMYRYCRQSFHQLKLGMYFDLLLHISLVWILSSELIHWMDLYHSTQSYKLGLSILWGGYSLLLIALGIWKHKKHIRIGAIALFGITLLKLFFYDIAHLNTISKTIVFVVLGALLLVISYLYNRYKHQIFEDSESKR